MASEQLLLKVTSDNVPDHWTKKSLAEVTLIIGGGTPNTKRPEYYGGKIPWITPRDLSNYFQIYIERGERNITEEGLKNSSAKILPKDTILFSSRAPIGYVVIAKNEVTTNQGFRSFVCKNDILNNIFFYYWLKLHKKDIEGFASGSTFKEISGGTLKNIQICLPPIKEQIKIANMLISLDFKIENNNKINKVLERMGSLLFKHWFVDFEFPNKDGKPYKSSGGEVVDSEMGEIPKGWEVKPIDQIATFLNGLALQKYPPKGENDLPVIKIREMKQGITVNSDKANNEIDNKYIIHDGDLLFSWSGSLEVDFWGYGTGALNQHLFKVTSEKYEDWFVYQWIMFHLPNYRAIAEGKATTMGHIKRQHLSESNCLIPDKTTLNRMNDYMEEFVNHMINNKTEIRKLSQTRDLLLPKLMSGEVRV